MPSKRKRVPKKAAKRPHAHVLGTSGAGKKRYLTGVVKAHAESGQQLGILDPHGELASAASPEKSTKQKG